MKVQAVAVVGVLFFMCLVFTMLALGGAAQRYRAVAAQARAESPLAQTYIVLDRYAAKWIPGVESASKSVANGTFSASWPAVEAQPKVALTVLFSHAQGALASLFKVAYWSTPILLLIFLFMLWRRPRPVHLIGG